MKRTSLLALSAMIAATALLSSCVGYRVEADPDRHPDAWKRHEMRHFYDSRHNIRHRHRH